MRIAWYRCRRLITENDGIMKEEDREAKAAVWLQRLREAAGAKESLVEYARRHGLKPGEAYRWRQNLVAPGKWPAHPANAARASRATVAPRTGAPRFARVADRGGGERACIGNAVCALCTCS